MAASGARQLAQGAVLVALVVAAVAAYLRYGPGPIQTHGPVVSNEGSSYSGNDALMGGRLEWDGDCLLLSGRAVVWPGGTRWDADREVLELPDGTEVEVGDSVSGGGGAFGGRGDTEWADSDAGRATAPCQAPGTEVTVFNRDADLEVERAKR